MKIDTVTLESNHIEAIGFDLFNTLITVKPQALEQAMDCLWKSLGRSSIDVDNDQMKKAHHQIAREYLHKARQTGQETHNRFWIRDSLALLGHNLSANDQRIADAVEAYFSAFYEHSCLIPKTFNMLSKLKANYRLGLLSNFTHAPAAKNILEKHKLSPFFDALLISGDLGYRKPHQIAFNALLDKLGVSKERCIYIGDDPECDIDGAWEAGIESIWMTYVRDAKIPLAPGPDLQKAKTPQKETPRISSWEELSALLPD
jgi:putative hydrolase of the HAD superfamily